MEKQKCLSPNNIKGLAEIGEKVKKKNRKKSKRKRKLKCCQQKTNNKIIRNNKEETLQLCNVVNN